MNRWMLAVLLLSAVAVYVVWRAAPDSEARKVGFVVVGLVGGVFLFLALLIPVAVRSEQRDECLRPYIAQVMQDSGLEWRAARYVVRPQHPECE